MPVEERLHDGHPDLTGNVAVAATRIPQPLLGRGGPGLRVDATLSHHRKGLQRVRHLGIGEPIVPVPPADLACKQAGIQQLAEVAAGRRRGHRRCRGQLTRACKLTAQEVRQHPRPVGSAISAAARATQGSQGVVTMSVGLEYRVARDGDVRAAARARPRWSPTALRLGCGSCSRARR